MPGVLFRYLEEDHERLDSLLQKAIANPDVIDMESYAEFRKGLLRHIAMEEKIVLPAIAHLQRSKQAAIAGQLRLDHGALVALLVPPPDTSIVLTIRTILQRHNALEEQEGGLYQLFEQFAGPDTERLLTQLRTAPEVRVMPHNGRLEVLQATRRAVARAGYEFKTSTQ